MIPPFNDSGVLPAGLHRATLKEISDRFGSGSELRRVQMESVRWMVELAVQAGIERIVLNGSFVTDIMEPNDVDCVLLAGLLYPRDREADEQLLIGLPFLEILIVDQDEFNYFANRFFAMDRFRKTKGMIEVIL